MILRFYLICLLVLFTWLACHANGRRYNVNVCFPNSVDLDKVTITVDDGIEITEVPSVYKKNNAVLSGICFARYLTIRFVYPLEGNQLSTKVFFINQDTASIAFLSSNSNDVLRSLEVFNAVEIEKFAGVKELERFIYKEKKASGDFFIRNSAQLDSSDSLLNMLNELDMEVLNKELDFIKKNGDLYYSFWFFKDRLIGNPNTFSADTLLSVFNSSFPDELRNSVEGQEVRKLLEGRTIKRYALAPDFTSKTYDGKPVKLSDMKGRFVVLDFWASWCGPCIELMPEIKKVRDKFPVEKVEIISVSQDKDTAAFLKNIEKHGMTWLNILADRSVSKSYGRRSLPDVYIIDRDGKIIYRGQTDDPVDYVTFLEAEMNKSAGSAKL